MASNSPLPGRELLPATDDLLGALLILSLTLYVGLDATGAYGFDFGSTNTILVGIYGFMVATATVYVFGQRAARAARGLVPGIGSRGGGGQQN